MKSEDAYDILDAIDALAEKCLDGYRVAIYYDPRDNTSWVTWTPPGAPASAEAGRGYKAIVFERSQFCTAVRQLVLDSDRIKSLRKFREDHDPPTYSE